MEIEKKAIIAVEDLQPEKVLLERFRLTSAMGCGVGMRMFAATTSDGDTACVKACVIADCDGDPKMEQIGFEADALRVLNANNIEGVPQLLRYDEDNYTELGVARLIITSPCGEPLAVVPGDQATLRQLAVECASILHHVHLAGIIHGDICPQNMIIFGGKARFIDFGSSGDGPLPGPRSHPEYQPQDCTFSCFYSDWVALALTLQALNLGPFKFEVQERSLSDTEALTMLRGLLASAPSSGDDRQELLDTIDAYLALHPLLSFTIDSAPFGGHAKQLLERTSRDVRGKLCCIMPDFFSRLSAVRNERLPPVILNLFHRFASDFSTFFPLATCRISGNDKDKREAVEVFRRLAEQGEPLAQYDLGVCLEQGIGTEKDEKQAVFWYRRAADQGYARAQFNLACCLDHGVGTAQDEQQAVAYYRYRKAADQGHADAAFNLAVSLERGSDTAKNPSKRPRSKAIVEQLEKIV